MQYSLLLLATLVITGCSSFMEAAHTPSVTQFPVIASPVHAYTQALHTATSMGTQITFASPSATMLQGTLHNAVALDITVSPHGAGSLITVSARLLPGKIVVGSLTEHEDFHALYVKNYGAAL